MTENNFPTLNLTISSKNENMRPAMKKYIKTLKVLAVIPSFPKLIT